MYPKVMELIKSGNYVTQKTDEFTHLVELPKSVIIGLMENCKPNVPDTKPKLSEIKDFFVTLPDDKNYTLICNIYYP
jgi:hypothetical protein